MPRYQITDNTGRTLVVEGDSPPTDEDADELFASLPPPVEAPKPGIMSRIGSALGFGDKESGQNLSDLVANSQGAPAPDPNSWRTKAATQLKASWDATPDWIKTASRLNPVTGGFANAVMTAPDSKLMDTAVGVVPAVAGTIAGGFVGMPGVGGAIGSGVGNSLVQARKIFSGEQKTVNPGEFVANTAAGAFVPGGLKPGMGIGKAILTRGGQGGLLAGTQEGIRQAIEEEKYDWGKIAQNGALGVGFGLVLGVPEAIALRKALGGSAPLEGKTLKEAVDIIAAEKQVPPEAVSAHINDLVLNGPPSTAREAAEVFQKQPMVKDAQASAEAILAGEAMRKSREEAFTLARAEEAIQLAKTQGITGAPEVRGASQPVRNAPMPPNRGPMLSPQAQRMADEYGGINPAVLMPVASAAMGGTIGAATGDTPEERVQNAMIGAGIAVSPFGAAKLVQAVKNTPVGKEVAEAAQSAWKSLRLLENRKAFMPKEIKNELRIGEQNAAALDFAGQSLVKDLDSAISGTGNVATQAIHATTVREFLDRKIPLAQVPAPVRVQAQKVRSYIDDLTDRAIKEGVVEGQLVTTMAANRGAYLRRSYEAFINPKFKFDPVLEKAAINALVTKSKLSVENATLAIAHLKNPATVEQFLTGAKVGGRDVSSLIKRSDVLPEVRAFLGEVHDPILAASQTIPRLAKLIEMHHAQEKVKEIGLKMGLFSKVETPNHLRKFVGDDSQTHPWLVGLYASDDTAHAFSKELSSGRTDAVKDLLWSGWTTGTSAAKVSKTVLNPISYSTNLIGGVWANLANGNFRVSSVSRGLMLGAEELGIMRAAFPKAPVREELVKELAELRKNGIIGESVIGTDLVKALDTSFWTKLHNPATKMLRATSKVYSGIDDFTRYLSYKAEVARYTAALPGATQAQIQKVAGETVRSTMPTYSEVPELLKKLSNVGATPQFVNFQYEVFRNAFNAVKVGLRDARAGAQTGNAALRNAGLKRLAAFGVSTVAAGSYGISRISRMEHEIDDEKDAAVRYFAAPWDKDASLLFTSKIERQKPVSFSNMSYVAPQAILWEAFEAAKRGEDDASAVGTFAKVFTQQWLGNPANNSLMMGAALVQMTGKDPRTGRPINIDKSDTEPTQADRIRYNFDNTFKPAFLDFADQTRKAVSGEVGPHGKVYSLEEQRNRLLGVRQTSFLPEQAVKYKANELASKINGAEGMYRNRVTQGKTPEEQAQDYQDAEARRKELFNEMIVAAKHAEKLFVNRDEFAAALAGAKVDATLIAGVLDGIYTPMARDKNEPASAIAEALYGKPDEQKRAELAKMYAADPFKAKDVLTAMRGMQRSDALKVSQYDEILMKMGIGNGERAAYINRKLESLPTTQARKAFVDELKAKRIITPEVLYQMQNPK